MNLLNGAAHFNPKKTITTISCSEYTLQMIYAHTHTHTEQRWDSGVWCIQVKSIHISMQLSFCKNGSRYAGYMFMSTKCLPNAGHVDFERGKSHTKYAKQCRTILLISFRCTFTFSFCQALIFPSSFFFFFFNSWCAAFCRHCVFSLSHALSPHHSCSLAQGL